MTLNCSSFSGLGGLDTNCMTCHRTFGGHDPPIRTIILDSVTSTHGRFDISIRVYNRHIGCLIQRKLPYTPISHVWHQSIAEANDSGQPSDEATTDVRITLVNVLFAVTIFEGKPTEIWHDYLSIPQWQKSVQQQLLLILPDIYALPSGIIVHHHDVASVCYENLFISESEEPVLEALWGVAASRWFSRMWVTLEYVCSQKAQILTRDWEIVTVPLQNILWDLKTRGDNKYLMNAWGTDERAMRLLRMPISNRENCLGAALDSVAAKDCRSYRDRFLAAHGMLYGRRYQKIGDASTLNEAEPSVDNAAPPLDPILTCRWLSEKCLAAGDYSPLLLRPIPEETVVSPNWLCAHSMMPPDVFPYRNQQTPPDFPQIMRDGAVQPDLELVGHISGKLVAQEGRSHVGLSEVIAVSGANAHDFIRIMENVWPPYGGKKLDIPGHVVVQVQNLLREYLMPIPDQNRRARQDILAELVEVLELEKETYVGQAWSKRPRPLGRQESTYKLECLTCAKVFLLLLHMREPPGQNAYVYRIPGLSYYVAKPGSVGLVIKEQNDRTNG